MAKKLSDNEVAVTRQNIRDEIGALREIAAKLPAGRERASVLAKLEVVVNELAELHPSVSEAEATETRKRLLATFERAAKHIHRLYVTGPDNEEKLDPAARDILDSLEEAASFVKGAKAPEAPKAEPKK